MRYLSAIAVFILSACSTVQQHEKIIQHKAQQEGLHEVAKSRFDATFVAPAADFGRYKKIIINDLDLSQVIIIQPSSQPFAQPWTLSDEDKRYYQARFAESARENLLASGLFLPATADTADTLVLTARITEIAPRAAKDDSKSRPNLMNVYSEGFGEMTIAFELADAATQKLVLLASDDRELGSFWELNNRVQNNVRVRQGFDYWLNSLEKELKVLGKHQ